MPRTARPWDPAAIVHVDARTHEGAHLFEPDEERSFILAAAARVFTETRTRCHAWAVLSNHYHFLVQSDSTPLGLVFQRINTRIAIRARRALGERGAVFQSRYFSRICSGDEAYAGMLAYVLGNPLRHRVVRTTAELLDHPWTGLREVLGLDPPRLIDVDWVLGHFHDDPRLARDSVRSLLESRAADWAASPDEEPDALPLSARVTADEQVRRETKAIVGLIDPMVGDWESRAARRAVLRAERWSPDRLVQPICARVGARPDAVRAGLRASEDVLARALIAFVACDFAGWPAQEVARMLSVSSSALSAARRRGREIVERLAIDPQALLDATRRTTSEDDSRS
jgi:REP element-mobilizing transposase RayT